MSITKPRLSFWQIINMNVGFFGIQYSFGLQQSAVNPIYDMLGASPDEIPLLNLAGPMTGLLVQPIIGALSDKTWSPRFGRRKPYFFIGAIMCSLALFLYPFSSSLWMAAGLLWILDAGNNTAMEPYRAFVADKLDVSQQPTGFQAQSFFTGFGQTLGNLSLFIFPMIFVGTTGKLPTWVYASFFWVPCAASPPFGGVPAPHQRYPLLKKSWYILLSTTARMRIPWYKCSRRLLLLFLFHCSSE
ncbi:MFS transporter [Phnomibacter ginsenosidimutans]|uniref:MFS transporter n=1 Tax=Phnomibacter ginsenosidimutans TaxID=2676868 RepID=UPI0018D23D76|nr:MFS transporter [Phnomibacter ginsenosidimutans]